MTTLWHVPVRWRSAFCRLLLLFATAARAIAVDYAYTINSEPAGYVNQAGVAAAGTVITTPALQGEVSGWMFAYWKVDGVRQAGANGAALPAAQFTLAGLTVATAVYIRTTDDTDGDGLPDWYEWQQFGDLSQNAAADPDGDGFSNIVESWRGYSPHFPDTIADGGVATRRSTRLSFAAAGDAAYTINSEPAGYVSQSGTSALGTVVTTPALQGEVSGWMFTYWKVNGQRQAGVNGAAVPAARFTLNGPTTATAVYIRATDDTDGDGLPDWYEWQQFGDLSQNAAADPDADGFSNGVESWRGYSPRLADSIADGGVASRRSAKLTFVSGSDALYTINSEPAGFVTGGGAAALGVVITTPALQGEVSAWMFAYWKVNGQRQADPAGAAVPAARFTLVGPTVATAVYIRTTDDTDGDGLADWYEWQQFGSLSQNATADPDGDGLSNAVESWRGYSPRLVDTIADGGVATRRSARFVYVAIATPPSITTQPTSQTVIAGSTVTFSVVAAGNPAPTYQWRKGGTSVSGATAAAYTISAVAASDAGSYDVVVTNSQGAVTSSVATLTVTPVPVITTQPVAQVVIAGSTATFTVAATNPGSGSLSYRWYFTPAGSSTPQALTDQTGKYSGTQTTSLTVSNVQAADTGDYVCVVTNGDGLATSNAAPLSSAALSGYEADINGNGTVSITDWVKVGRIVAGLDLAPTGVDFMKADCAPRSSLGNGTLSVTDWVQAGRYAAGLDPLTPVGGPSGP